MLERVRTGIDMPAERQHGGEPRWQRLRLPEMTPQAAEAQSAFRARRSFPVVQLAGRATQIGAAWGTEAPDIAAPWCATIRVDRTAAELILPHTLLDLIFRHADPVIAASALRLDHAALVLEFALSDALAELEAALGWSMSLTSVAKGSGLRDNARDAFVPIALQLQGAGAFWGQLRLEAPYLLALSHYLDRISSVPEHHIDVPLPVHLRWAMAELTLAELRGLTPGDIILANYSCGQPGTALAVIGEHLVAPVELLLKGYRFGAKPRPALGSGWEWALDRTMLHASDGGEGTASDVPMRLFFELGQLEAERSAVAQLQGGTLMALARPVDEGVDIVVSGARIGRGQITKVGDAAAIRVTRL
jgi:flagellar motor switch/type III secretory pathway protein FliN